MLKLKQAKYLEDHLKNLIDNASFACVPPERAIVNRVGRPLIHESTFES